MGSRLALAALAAAAINFVSPAQAAESYDNCTGFIDSTPAVLTTQGTWCLRKDLSTSASSGAAITIATNNVTIDCNNFKIGGLAAGPGTGAAGIKAAYGRQNIAVRNCNIRGFQYGIHIDGGGKPSGGHLIEDNVLESNTAHGILLWQVEGSTIRSNRVLDTGGWSYNTIVPIAAAYGANEIYDNLVSGATTGPDLNGDGWVIGISGSGSLRGNRVRGLVPVGEGAVVAIEHSPENGGGVLRDNDVMGTAGTGLACNGASAIGNVVVGFDAPTVDCVEVAN